MEINVAPPPVVTDGTVPGGPEATTAAATPAPGATPAPPARASTSPTGMSPTRLWDMAFAEYAAGQYDLAVIGFESYIREFPRSEQADDAQVYIASSYLNDGKNDRAVEAADMAIRTYPKADTVATAYSRKAQALANLRRTDEARAAYEFILKTYPDTAEATLARQNLEKLK
jgi:TolA-binding protein